MREVECVVHEEEPCTSVHTCKELDKFANSFKQKFGECVGMDFGVWDNGGRNINVGQAKIFDVGTLSGELMK